jgi:polyhydroxyalkanoate synthesis regulator phasin
MNEEFPAAVREALAHYDVPPLPDGFSDRLIERIANENIGKIKTPASSPASWLRNSSGQRIGPWGRSGKILTTVAAFSLATATAAATGVFGEPAYVPVISQVLASAKLINDPRQSKLPPIPKKPVLPAVRAKAAVVLEYPQVQDSGTQAAVDRVRSLKDDPEFQAMPLRERLAAARAAVLSMVQSGEVTPQEARDAVRNLVRDADPAVKAHWREAAAARKEKRQSRRHSRQQQISATKVDDPLVEEMHSQAPPETLRDRLRNASPEQKAALRDALLRRRQERQAQTQ